MQMRPKIRHSISLALCTAMLSLAVASPVQATEIWRMLLEQQLLKQEKCRLNYLTGLSQKKSSKGLSVTARAHCHDTRSFDVKLEPGDISFKIHACQPSYC